MKLGIKKIEFIQAALCKDWSYMPRSGQIKLSNFISDSLQELPFTMDTGVFEEKWEKTSAGIRSVVNISGSIRQNRYESSAKMMDLLRGNYVFVITTNEGIKYIIGSIISPIKFSYTDSVSNISMSEYSFNAECETLHGALIDNN
jgi:hypothetical protein